MSESVLALETLTAGYDEAAVIRDVDLAVRPGEVVALLGANGAGKTTTLRVVSGLVISRRSRRAPGRGSASRTFRRAGASSSG
jgi:branched-chain amino acid transport system ATP-binding protein